jgi:predicted RNA-binding Zn ribbon-like protein
MVDMDELADRFPPLIGNAPCLDFANTLETHRDHLRGDYRQLLRWAEHAGVIGPRLGTPLRRRAKAEPESATGVMKEAVRLRTAIFRVFAAVATGARPDAADLAVVRDGYATALQAAVLAPTGDGLQWAWPEDSPLSGPTEPLTRPLWPISVSAARLATSAGQLQRVKVCAGEGCNWLFVDTSKNRSRRWCLMRYCGNVGKSQRQAAHRRAGRASSQPTSGTVEGPQASRTTSTSGRS